ncbi:unnamed protein product, partial [Pylaiella littoralis]
NQPSWRAVAAREVKWCQLHNSPHHTNEECQAQAAGQMGDAHAPTHPVRTPQQNSRNSGRQRGSQTVRNDIPSTAAQASVSPPSADTELEPCSSGSSYSFTSIAKAVTRPVALVSNGGSRAFTMLVDSGASSHFIDSDILPDVQLLLDEYKYQELHPPTTITTAGLHELSGRATGRLQVD